MLVTKEVCALAYRSSVLPLFEGRGDRDPCGTEYSSAALEAMGGPGYTAESRPWVKRAFESLCVYRYPTPSNSPDQRWLVSGALPVMDL